MTLDFMSESVRQCKDQDETGIHYVISKDYSLYFKDLVLLQVTDVAHQKQ